jgi:hypothetical protein
VKDLRFFHLTGARLDAAPTPPPLLRPALFAGFHDLTALRYDFPVVLFETDGEFVRSLTSVIDELLREIAPRGMAGERMRRSVLRLEREIRALVAKGAFGSLTSLWQRAADRLATRGGAPLASDLTNACAALHVDGEVVDCDARLPERLVTHAWRTIERRRSATMRRHLEGLIARLADLVRADHLRSRSGRTPAALKSAIAPNHQELFDFDAMSRLLAKPSGASNLGDARRKRIEATLETLRSEPFFGAESGFEFTFSRADDALAAFRARLPALARLVRAIAVAELEVEGEYVEATHDDYFATIDERALRPEDLARFPSYLVRIRGAQGGEGRTQLLEVLSSSAPLKLLVVSEDLLEMTSGELAVSFETRLATSAIGLGGAFVLQSPSSHLYRVRDRLSTALSAPGPSLVSVFSGAIPGASVPPYLAAAAALESRAFPIFSYDPTATVKLSLDGNPQPERTWPEHELAYADADQQRVVQRIPFTFADFAAADRLLASHFSRVPTDRETGTLVDMRTWLEDGPDWRQSLPFVYGIDLAQHVQKLVVDEQLVRAARRSIAGWLRLCELAPHDATAPSTKVVPAPPDPAPPILDAPAAVAADPAAPAPDEPYIETPRCTTCNECVLLDGAMFAYNENKQAFIKDPTAGSFRTLVEAAEGCQVAIIHPGRPRDPNESGLEELLRRAEPFK